MPDTLQLVDAAQKLAPANASPVTTASSSPVREPVIMRGIGAWRRYASGLQPLRARHESELGDLA